MFYAHLDPNNIVIGVSQLTDKVTRPDMIEIPACDDSLVGQMWDGTSFVAAPPDPVLAITLDASVTTVGGTVTATAEVRQGGNLVPLDGTYYVPVIGIDGRMDQMLTVNFAGGQATVPVTFGQAGIYTLDMTKIRPKPSAALSESPEVIVT
jgi:hypothetical protein